MRYMVVEHYTSGPGPVYARAAAYGRMLPDGLHYVFKLRPGVKWHDGKDFTSADVAFSLLLLKQVHPRGRSTFANLTEVLTLADWVLMIRHGRLVAQGVPRDALRPTSAMTQLSDAPLENVLPAVVKESDAAAGTSRVRLASGVELFIPYSPHPAGAPCQIRVSADDILIATERPQGISTTNVLGGTIRRIESFGGDRMVTVFAGEEFFVNLTAAAVARLGLREAQPVFLIIKTRSCRVL